MLDLYNSLRLYSEETLVCAILMTILTTIAVILRFLSKWLSARKLALDDLFLGIAQMAWYSQVGLQFHALLEGREAKSLMDPHITTFVKYSYFSGEMYFPIVLTTNISILLLYQNIFGIDTKFRRLTLGLIILHVLWFIPGFIAETLLCIPVKTIWENPANSAGKCIYYSTYFVVLNTMEIVLDLLIFALPINGILKLSKLSWQKKSLLSFIFLLGGFVVITGIVRMAVTVERGQENIELVRDIFWLDIHLGVGIICACLPTYRVLLRKSSTVISERYKRFYTSRSNLRSNSKPSATPSREQGTKENQSSSVATSHLWEERDYARLDGNEVNLLKIRGSTTGERENSVDEELAVRNQLRVD